MVDIVSLTASVDGIPTVAETDAILAELRQMPRTVQNTSLMDDLLEFRSLLTAATE
ncbi:hypothetical protein Ga0074812_101165 [Parafrankia irregularis]|uniref:Uncharacterized protein n=1 Tax=Parafrankia irregularis TaxID=795642 RepID=A0A0S4QDX6_9ACTN|nr:MULTISPECIES: hypothetical protein [Frankiaceae]MBE3199664.1 hypothetical protein [Parafrankia sp. CH37]CUU53667.1 hypothetical protein Ga0074812_101165 [Parafrankia irregularis]